MTKSLKTSSSSSSNNSNTILEVKSKFDAEFRRFGLNKQILSKFEEFYRFLERLHGLQTSAQEQFIICYTDKDGDLLPINNDNNYTRVLNVTQGILRIIIQRKGECYDNKYHTNNTNQSRTSNNLLAPFKSNHHNQHYGASSSSSYSLNRPLISYPEDFRPVSAIIDVDILPDTYRRVRLHKHKSSKPLGFYIRDGRSFRVTPQGVEQVPSIFISRLMPGGLAESTGLLSVNDEVIEVNGIEVSGKTLDQVTDMMIANSSNLIITVKPANQRYNLNRSSHSNNASNRSITTNQSNWKNATNKNTPSSGTSSISSNSLKSQQQQQQQHPLQHQSSQLKSNITSTPNINPVLYQMSTHQDTDDDQHLHNDDEDDDDDDDEEIHDPTSLNSKDDKILTL